MGKVGGGRNFGYGKMLAYAGKNALKDRYGDGHYATVAAHEARWKVFVSYLKDRGIKDARDIKKDVIMDYANELNQRVRSGDVRVSYAQNLLSSINVILNIMLKGGALYVPPSAAVGRRSNIRNDVPGTVNRGTLERPIQWLHSKGEERLTVMAMLCREFGLRFKEASLLNCKTALRQATKKGCINVIRGTKGGRGKDVDRWVPASLNAMTILSEASAIQGKRDNIIPPDNSYIQWRNHANSQWRLATKNSDIRGFHELRAAYACDRYQQLTGCPAPVLTGNRRTVDKAMDQKARAIIGLELGHSRTDILVSYIGSAR